MWHKKTDGKVRKMYDFIRIAAAVPKLSVGDVLKNEESIEKKLDEAEERYADIVLFPELAVTGYTCADLFFQSALLKAALGSLKKLCERSRKSDAVIVVGAPILINGQLYNCAAVIAGGRVRGIVPKTFIPTYNEFYEKRWFSSSEDLNVTSVCSSELGFEEEYGVPIGRNLIFNVNNEFRFGAEICEDVWAPLSPGCFLAMNGAEVILNISASNETISKRSYRRQMISQQSASQLSAYVYASSGAEESTTDLVFSGHVIFAENGTVVAENENSIDSDFMLVSDIDIGKIKADRMKIKTFKDAASVYGKHEPAVYVPIKKKSISGDGKLYHVNKLPFVPQNKKDRAERCRNIFEIQVSGLKKRLSVTGCKPVIGISGGLDSTLALLVSAEAARQLKMPLSDVTGITMPCFGTTDRTYNNALKLMKSLGVTSKEINIKEACLGHFKDIGHSENVYDLIYENCQARERTQVLMDYAGKIGGLVVGTGDLSELALGWCTYNADHMSMYGVNCGVPKTLVRWMIDSIIEYDLFPKSTEVLKDITDTPISPELLPPDEDGKIAQKTEDIVGPYELHDFFLYNIIRFGFSPKKVYYLACLAFCGDFEAAEIKKWLKSFYRRFFSQQFKRSCLPDGVKVGSICLSPRGDWRMPSDASAAVWLREIEEI